jgi:hypothetical protein
MFFAVRVDAGRRLAARLHLRPEPVVVLGLPPAACRSRLRWRGLSARRRMSLWSESSGVPFPPELGHGRPRRGRRPDHQRRGTCTCSATNQAATVHQASHPLSHESSHNA